MPFDETILLTGAGGRLGMVLRAPLLAAGYRLRLTDCRTVRHLHTGETFHRARLGSNRAMRRVCGGVDAILHLGGVATEESWKNLAQGNVDGLVTVFEAARASGVSRMVFASTMHVLGLHRRDEPICEASEARPDTRYAATKLFGEAVCRQFAGKYGMAVTIVRIGHVVPDIGARPLGQAISEHDLGRLLLLALGLTEPGLRVFHAVAPQSGDTVTDGRLARDYGFRFDHPGYDQSSVLAALQDNPSLGARGMVYRGGDFAEKA